MNSSIEVVDKMKLRLGILRTVATALQESAVFECRGQKVTRSDLENTKQVFEDVASILQKEVHEMDEILNAWTWPNEAGNTGEISLRWGIR